MRIPETLDQDTFRQLLVSDQIRYDYVYSYPPRQAYRQFARSPEELVATSLESSTSLNLYLHFPFCAQICNFCNLYAVADTSNDAHTAYCETLIAEMRQTSIDAPVDCVPSLYLGGGTPSLLASHLVSRVLRAAEGLLQRPVSEIQEVAMEVDPATTTPTRLAEYGAAGINRVNFGYQSTSSGELLSIGRRRSRPLVGLLRSAAADSGINNVCVDLIYGLPGQSSQTWQRSLEEVIAVDPETICAYPLTIRPFTGFGRLNIQHCEPAEMYQRYDVASEYLSAAGYRQESNVRWTKRAFGYLQKSQHWNSSNILGLGAGARSYLRYLDTRAGYSVRQRRVALADYERSVSAGYSPITDGYVLDEDERMRKSIILGLGGINDLDFKARHQVSMFDQFALELSMLDDAGILDTADGFPRLTPKGLRHRDVAVQVFFSEEVRNRIRSFDYAE